MRKHLTALTVLFLFSVTSLSAQYGYIRFAGGASWNNFQKTGQVLAFRPDNSLPLAQRVDPAYSLIVPMLNSNTSDSANLFIKNMNDGYGRGGLFSFFGGYMVNPYFGIELGFTYLFGSTISSVNKFDDALLGKGTSLTVKTRSAGMQMLPGVYLRAAKPEAKFAPYARLGLALPIFGSTRHSIDIDGPNGGLGYSRSKIEVQTESVFSLGVTGGVGVSYTPIPLITIFTEMNGQYLFVRSGSTRITEYSVTAGNLTIAELSGLSTYSKEINFVNEINSGSNTTEFGKSRVPSGGPIGNSQYVDEDKPRDALRQSANFSGVGFSIGVTINLSKNIFNNPTGKKE